MALVIMAAISFESYFFTFKFCYIIIICMQEAVFTQWNGKSDGDNRLRFHLNLMVIMVIMAAISSESDGDNGCDFI